MKLFYSLPLVALLSACASNAPNNVKTFPRVEDFDLPTSSQPEQIQTTDISLPDFDVQFEDTPSKLGLSEFSQTENSYVVARSQGEQIQPPGPIPLPQTRIGRLDFPNATFQNVAKALVADSFGMALVFSLEEEISVTFSGGPFTQESALLALEDLARSKSLSYKQNGSVVLISDGSSDTGISVGYTRVYRASADALANAVNTLQSGATMTALGRSVAVSGSSSAVKEALELVQKFDRDIQSEYPWALVRVSREVSAQAEELVLSLETDSSPLSASVTTVGDTSLVLVVGQDRDTVDAYVSFLKSIEQGLPRKYLKTLPIQNTQSVLSALKSVFAAEESSGDLTMAATDSGELWLRGNIELVGEAMSFLEKQKLISQYVELRAVVAETSRGSAIDRSITLGLTPDFLSPVQLTSTSGAPTLSLQHGGFSAALSWLDSDSQTRLLSTPRLSVVSGGAASLTVGSQVPVLSSESVSDTGQKTQEIQYRDVGVVLDVQPVVQSDGRLKVKIVQELSTAGTNTLTSLDSPSFDQRRLETELVFLPGEVVSAAGLDFATQDNKEAVLGRDASVSSRKLVILMTGTLPDLTNRKRQVDASLAEIRQAFSGAIK